MMKCPNCGTEFLEGIFCPECGTKVVEITEEKEVETAKMQEEAVLSAKRKAEEAEAQAREAQAKLVKEKAEADAKLARIEAEKAIKAEKEKKREESRPHNKAVLSLIMGIIALITGGVLIVPEVLGVIFGFQAKKDGKLIGKAIVGIILSSIAAMILILAVIVSAK